MLAPCTVTQLSTVATSRKASNCIDNLRSIASSLGLCSWSWFCIVLLAEKADVMTWAGTTRKTCSSTKGWRMYQLLGQKSSSVLTTFNGAKLAYWTECMKESMLNWCWRYFYQPQSKKKLCWSLLQHCKTICRDLETPIGNAVLSSWGRTKSGAFSSAEGPGCPGMDLIVPNRWRRSIFFQEPISVSLDVSKDLARSSAKSMSKRSWHSYS